MVTSDVGTLFMTSNDKTQNYTEYDRMRKPASLLILFIILSNDITRR